MKIFEIVAPTTQQYDTWYHGTPSKKGAELIMKNGLAYDDKWVEQKYKTEPEFAPMKDGVYITKDLGQAYRYTLMGKHPDKTGYIFKFPGSHLQSISNDEDEMGNYIVKNLEQYPELNGKISNQIIKGAMEGEYKECAMAGKIALQYLSKDKIDTLLNTLDSINLVHYGKLQPISVIEVPKIGKEEFEKLLTDKVTTFKPLADYVTKYGKERKLT
jgi:hypothetical protein